MLRQEGAKQSPARTEKLTRHSLVRLKKKNRSQQIIGHYSAIRDTDRHRQ